jgi:hypothetical protein
LFAFTVMNLSFIDGDLLSIGAIYRQWFVIYGAVVIIRQSDSPTNALNWWKFWKIIWPNEGSSHWNYYLKNNNPMSLVFISALIEVPLGQLSGEAFILLMNLWLLPFTRSLLFRIECKQVSNSEEKRFLSLGKNWIRRFPTLNYLDKITEW